MFWLELKFKLYYKTCRLLRIHPAEESKRTSFKRYQALPKFEKNADDGESEDTQEVLLSFQ